MVHVVISITAALSSSLKTDSGSPDNSRVTVSEVVVPLSAAAGPKTDRQTKS